MNQDEYQIFLKEDPVSPPASVTTQIMNYVRDDLHPELSKVSAKLFAIHFLTAAFTLSICPQLGVRLLGDGPGLMHFFMGLGRAGCAVACGFFFLGTSFLVALIVLRLEELKVIQRAKWPELAGLALVSALGLFALNPQDLTQDTVLWAAGAVLGGFAVLQMGCKVRFTLSSFTS